MNINKLTIPIRGQRKQVPGVPGSSAGEDNKHWSVITVEYNIYDTLSIH